MPSIFDIHNRGINWNYRRSTTNFTNEYFKGAEWRCDDEHYVRLAIDDKAFDVTNIYYDGHYFKSVTFLWIQIGYGYSWESKPVADW